MNWLTLFLAPAVLISCASSNSNITASNQISNGMSAADVQVIMGPPQNRQFSGNDEAWQWCATDYTGGGGDQFVLVWLNSGTVSGLERYTNTRMGTCETFFKNIQFEQAPDATIEFRNR